MSWQVYVDYLKGGNCVSVGALMDHAGNVLGSSNGSTQLPSYELSFEDETGKVQKVKVDERANLLDALAKGGQCGLPGGIRLFNEKYMCVQFDQIQQVMYLKRASGGACVARTGKCLLLGIFDSSQLMANQVPQNPGECNKRVEMLAQELLKIGY
jgi:hypothetical protein